MAVRRRDCCRVIDCRKSTQHAISTSNLQAVLPDERMTSASLNRRPYRDGKKTEASRPRLPNGGSATFGREDSGPLKIIERASRRAE
jgi:hypothetical protein